MVPQRCWLDHTLSFVRSTLPPQLPTEPTMNLAKRASCSLRTHVACYLSASVQDRTQAL